MKTFVRARLALVVPALAFALAAITLLFTGRPAYATPLGGLDPAFESRLEAELEETAPDAVSTWREANAARNAGEFVKAAPLFAAVIAKAPGYVPAQRRECSVLAASGHRREALKWCRSAIASDDSPENAGALAAALMTAPEGLDATDGASDNAEALGLAKRATAAKPDQAYLWAILVQAAGATHDLETMRHASDRLLRLAPDSPEANLYAAVVAGASGDGEGAHRLLDRARADGLSSAAYDHFNLSLDEEQGPWWVQAARAFAIAVALWLLCLGALLLAGMVLSHATLSAIAERPTEPHVRSGELRLRKTYRAVLWCAGAYYYASLPLLAVAVLAATLGTIAAIIAVGFVAIKLFIVLLIVAFGSLVSIVRSVFVRVRDEDPGIPLDLEANPTMRDALREVAQRVGTAPVDRVFITPFTEVAVLDRGSLGMQLRGSGQRCLVLGAGVLDGMRVRSFKSVLAHEYGHFRNEDTAGGGFALSVRRSLGAMTRELVVQRVASNLNVAWWFVRGFSRAFLGVSQGASRLQEVLADRAAAFAYGSAAFEDGLRHVVKRTVTFDAHVGATLDEVIKARTPLPNLYSFVPEAPPPEDAMTQAITRAITREPSPYDSHPRPEDRLLWVQTLACEGAPASPDDGAEAWSLFADRAAIEAQMTGEVRRRLQANRGIVVRAH